MKEEISLNLTPGDQDAAESLRRAIAAEQTTAVEQPAPAPAVVVTPNPLIVTMLGGVITKALDLSKKRNWSSPSIPGMLSEEDWCKLVTENTAIVIARHFPRLNDGASEEFTLAALLLPWVIGNLIGMLFKSKTKPAETEALAPAA
jgi:hypothetical protein